MAQQNTAPRLPTEEEKKQLGAWNIRSRYDDMLDANGSGYIDPRIEDEIEDEVALSVANASIAVFDHYTTDGPGYTGKVIVVIWPDAPELFNLFTWNDETVVELKQGER